MNTKKYHWILYLITATIVATIAVQLYWNYKNYELNKQRVLNEIQISLDNAIDLYYTDLSKKNFFAIVKSEDSLDINWTKSNSMISIFDPQKKDSFSSDFSTIEINTDNNKESKMMKAVIIDSIVDDVEDSFYKNFKDSVPKEYSKITQFTQFSKDGKSGFHIDTKSSNKIKKVHIFRGKKATDSLKLIKGLQTIFVAIQNDSLNHTKIDSLLKSELYRKKISTSYYLDHTKDDTIFYSNKMLSQPEFTLTSVAKSTYLKPNEKLILHYNNPTYEAFKRSFTGILLSLLLSVTVVASLFYLLKIINQQKQLAEIKNDLISNITHEFKTPITTVSTAIEAIADFNALNDTTKTKKYLSISAVQLNKLNLMVEKLLETATLDSENLLLKKEPVNIIHLIEKITKKYQLIIPEKTISFSSNINVKISNIDIFHFENAISNLIDNAAKYGGNQIEVTINSVLDNLEISIVDNGDGIDKNHREKVFDKFYRVPKGNTHDVKGFGIGLYYTKKIIEKHGGTIHLSLNNNLTTFKIFLPNA